MARATTFIPRPFEEYVQKAPQIIRGQVQSVRSDWSTDLQGTRRIYTFTEIRVREVLKGEAREFPESSTLVAREIGGEKDGVGLMIAGTAEFKVGEEVVVFVSLQKNPDQSHDLTQMMLSKLEVSTDPQSGEEVLRGPAIEIARQYHDDDAHSTDPSHSHSQKTASNTRTLAELRQIIQRQGGSPLPAPPNAEPSTEESSTGPQPVDPASASQSEITETPSAEALAPEASASSTPSENPYLFPVLSFLGIAGLWIAFRSFFKK